MMNFLFSLLLVLFIACISMADDKTVKFENKVNSYVKQNFKEFEIVNMVKLPESYIKLIPDDFDTVECKSKGNSELYLYLSCFTYKDGKLIGEIPVTYRISQLNKDGSLTPIVHKNQKINIIYIYGNFKIQLLGTALENGRVGSYIKVRNISTGKELVGKVIDQQTVLVEGE